MVNRIYSCYAWLVGNLRSLGNPGADLMFYDMTCRLTYSAAYAGRTYRYDSGSEMNLEVLLEILNMEKMRLLM